MSCERKHEPIHYENGIRIVDKFAEMREDVGAIRVVTGWEVDDRALLDEYTFRFRSSAPTGRM